MHGDGAYSMLASIVVVGESHTAVYAFFPIWGLKFRKHALSVVPLVLNTLAIHDLVCFSHTQ